ncbi:hypothetical protein GJR96_07060 [Haloferax sp. MBLA0076]|uniref:Uncharacterized protein n=2 Tax=Haloferax TaxID=2251 RepID=A0A6A8GE98_9EURY|nr:hypothetical protein [Haloferax litoreum]KAB1193216.1 hypothetical protein Hfx1148_07050 [Haloferax sp. CBA1148]MRX21714.1 hypothetical protein [Haloferax litoreum]
MDFSRPVRPHRRLLFPFVVVLFPLLAFVYRDAGVRIVDGQQVNTPLLRTLTLTVTAIAVSYTIAIAVARAVGERSKRDSAWTWMLFHPSNGTIAILGILWSLIVGYVALNSAVTLPPEASLVVGIPLAWPLFILVLLMYAIGNAFPVFQASFAAQAAFVAIGYALTSAWLFLFSTWIASTVLHRQRRAVTE